MRLSRSIFISLSLLFISASKTSAISEEFISNLIQSDNFLSRTILPLVVVVPYYLKYGNEKVYSYISLKANWIVISAVKLVQFMYRRPIEKTFLNMIIRLTKEVDEELATQEKTGWYKRVIIPSLFLLIVFSISYKFISNLHFVIKNIFMPIIWFLLIVIYLVLVFSYYYQIIPEIIYGISEKLQQQQSQYQQSQF